MSFDVFFTPCRLDGTTRVQLNPFTNQLQDLPYNEPLSTEEQAAVVNALKRAGADGPDATGYAFVQCNDGGNAEIFGDNIGEGCMFAIRGAGVTRAIAQLLFDVLVAGNWAMSTTGLENVVVVPTPHCMKGGQRDTDQIVVVTSAQELFTLLSEGFETWRKYREQVIK